MKTRLLSLLAVVALALGSFALVASAQSYGEEPESSTSSESTDTDAQADDAAAIVEVQSTEDGADEIQEGSDADETEEAERGDNGRRRGHRGGCNLEAAAIAIGVDETDLRAALDGGQTIAEVAEANGVDTDTVIDAMVDAKAERLAEKVESGRISQEEADEKLADIEDRITNQVNGVDDDEGTDA